MEKGNNNSNYPGHYQDDEIDLVELFKTFWFYKNVFFLIVFFSLVLGVGYIFYLKPVYQTSIYFSKPSEQDISEINSVFNFYNKNHNQNTFPTQSTDQIFNQFLVNLESILVLDKFLNQDEIYQIFQKELKQESKEQKIDLLLYFAESLDSNCDNPEINQDLFKGVEKKKCLSFNFVNPKDTQKILDLFYLFVSEETKSKLIEQRKFEINRELNRLKNQVENLRREYFSDKSSRLIHLNEMLTIANQNQIDISIINQADNRFSMEYMRGTKSIQAEIDALNNRVDEDLFALKTASIQSQIDTLENIFINLDKLKVSHIELASFVPEKPIKPKKILTILFFLVTGIIFAFFFVVVRHFYKVNFKK